MHFCDIYLVAACICSSAVSSPLIHKIKNCDLTDIFFSRPFSIHSGRKFHRTSILKPVLIVCIVYLLCIVSYWSIGSGSKPYMLQGLIFPNIKHFFFSMVLMMQRYSLEANTINEMYVVDT